MSSILKVDQLQDSGGNAIITSNGSGTFTSSLPNTGITMADHWRITASTNSGTNATLSSNWERVDDASFEKIGTGMTESSGIFSFPSTGKYLVTEFWTVNIASGDLIEVQGAITTDNSTYTTRTSSIVQAKGGSEYNLLSNQYLIDVTNISNVKILFRTNSFASGSVVIGNTDNNRSSVSFLRIGDT